MSELENGRVEGLMICGREPDFTAPPIVKRARKLGGPHRQRHASSEKDFILKKAVVDLFAEFDRIKDGELERIDVQDGLPVMVISDARIAY